MQPQTAPEFPRTYRASASNAAVMYVLGGICAGAGALGVWYFGTGQDPKVHGSGAVTLAVLSFAFFLLGSYLIYAVAHFRIVLTADAIAIQTLSRPRSYLRAEFSAWRTSHPTKGPDMLALKFCDPARRELKIPLYCKLDDVFLEWLAGFDNADQVERAAAEREIAENTELGSTADERLLKLAAAGRTSKILIGTTAAACCWVLFFPYRYGLAVTWLAAIPWIAVFIAGSSHGLFRIDDKRNDPHPNVAIAFIMPGLILALRAITDVHLFGWKTPLIITLAITAALWFAAWKADASLQRNRATALLIFVVGLAYGFGAMTLSNALLDRGKADVYPARVLGKEISHGRSTTYRLYLDGWGPQATPDWVDVSHSFYNVTPKGSTVCVYLRPGAWKIPWYVVRRCAR